MSLTRIAAYFQERRKARKVQRRILKNSLRKVKVGRVHGTSIESHVCRYVGYGVTIFVGVFLTVVVALVIVALLTALAVGILTLMGV